MSIQNYATIATGDLTFSNINLNEIDSPDGSSGFVSFASTTGAPQDASSGSTLGFGWVGLTDEVSSSGGVATENLMFSYNISVTDSSQFITAMNPLYGLDINLGTADMVATERVYDAANNLIGTNIFDSSTSGTLEPPTTLAYGVQSAYVSLEIDLRATTAGDDIRLSTLAQNFTETPASQLGGIGGGVYDDTGLSGGTVDSSAPPVAGVMVELLNAADNSVVATELTDATGDYLFNGLQPGTYEAEFQLPAGYDFSTLNTGGTIDPYTPDPLIGITAPIVVGGGTIDSADAGLSLSAGPSNQAPSGAVSYGDFNLGDTANYAIIAFNPHTFKATPGSVGNGEVGVGPYSAIQDRGAIVSGTAALAADITELKALSRILGADQGTNVALSNGGTLNAGSGMLDSAGDEIFTVTKWSTSFTISGNGNYDVVLNLPAGVTPTLGTLNLTGGITANQVLINDLGTGDVHGVKGQTNATVLAPNAKIDIGQVTLNGHLFGGAAGQDFVIGSNAKVSAPLLAAGGQNVIVSTSALGHEPIGSGVKLDANVPATGTDLFTAFGPAGRLEFAFNPGTSVSTQSQGNGATIATATLGLPKSPSFILVSNNASDSPNAGTDYFEGQVTAGSKFYADATVTLAGVPDGGEFSTLPNADLYMHVFANKAAFQAGSPAVQEIRYDTSGAHGMSLDDTIGSAKLIGYVGANGHGFLGS